MSEQHAPQLAPPQYLAEVETRIDLNFFSDPAKETLAHTEPDKLPLDELVPRYELYAAGLRVLAEERRARRTLQEPGEDLVYRHREKVSDIRSALMLLDPTLQTTAVRGLNEALQQMRAVRRSSTGENRPRRPPDMLRPDVMPVGAVDRMLKMGRGSTLISLRLQKIPEAARIKLPGPSPAEVCVDWKFIAGLAELHDFRDEGFSIVWSRLPRGPHESDPERIAYAREIQKRFVEPHKLSNIPEIGSAKAPNKRTVPVAQRHHISHTTLARLMGGGRNFIGRYATEHGIRARLLQRPDGFGFADYFSIEEAAGIWQAYHEVPPASENDITVIDVAHRANISDRSTIYKHMTPSELAQVAPMRARKPAGRILDHVPVKIGEVLIGRVSPINLPPHLLPLGTLDKIVPSTYSGIHHWLNDAPQHPPTVLRLTGLRLPLHCYDWQAVRHLAVKSNDDILIPLDWSRLPRGPHESDPERIAYAREIQAQMVPPAVLDSNAAKRPVVAVVPEGVHLQELTEIERPPVYLQSLPGLLEGIPEEQRPDLDAAIAFIRAHGGQVQHYAGYGHYVLGESAGLINYNFGRPHLKPQQPIKGRLNRYQLAARTGQTLEQIDQDLAAINWNEVRPNLHTVYRRRIKDEGDDDDDLSIRLFKQATVHIIWCRAPEQGNIVLPHYNQAIVERVLALARERQRQAEDAERAS